MKLIQSLCGPKPTQIICIEIAGAFYGQNKDNWDLVLLAIFYIFNSSYCYYVLFIYEFCRTNWAITLALFQQVHLLKQCIICLKFIKKVSEF